MVDSDPYKPCPGSTVGTPRLVGDGAQKLCKNLLWPKTSGPKFRCFFISVAESAITTRSAQPAGGSSPAMRLTENVSEKRLREWARWNMMQLQNWYWDPTEWLWGGNLELVTKGGTAMKGKKEKFPMFFLRDFEWRQHSEAVFDSERFTQERSPLTSVLPIKGSTESN